MMYSLPAGSFDAKRHGNYVGCARAELWEEVRHKLLIPLMSTCFVLQQMWHLDTFSALDVLAQFPDHSAQTQAYIQP